MDFIHAAILALVAATGITNAVSLAIIARTLRDVHRITNETLKAVGAKQR